MFHRTFFMLETVVSLLTSSLVLLSNNYQVQFVSPSAQLVSVEKEPVLASATLDLCFRHPQPKMSQGFKENILKALEYLEKDNGDKTILAPGEVFAFHRNVLPEFKDEKIVTQNSGFLAKEGYKVVGGLQGNGVCHLASLMNKVGREAGLEVTSLVSHDFAQIPGIEEKYGASVFFLPEPNLSSQRQNLYIKNNQAFPVEFVFDLKDDCLLHFSIKKPLWAI